MEITLLPVPDGSVIARGSYFGGPAYEFVTANDGQVYFRVVGDSETVWAGPNPDSFRSIADAWKNFISECRNCIKSAKRELIAKMRGELTRLGALPTAMPCDPEPLWSMLLTEAENELG